MTYERLSTESLAWYSFIHKKWYLYRNRVMPSHLRVPDLALILQGVKL